MIQHVLQRLRVAAAQEVEIDLRDHPAGDVLLAAQCPKHLDLQVGQGPAWDPVAPEPASQVEQVDMGKLLQRRAQALEGEPRLQQRYVEGLAVEGRNRLAGRQEGFERGQLGRFLAGVAQKELLQDKFFSAKAA